MKQKFFIPLPNTTFKQLQQKSIRDTFEQAGSDLILTEKLPV
jgi:hypothetical protein